jgi:histidine triad (HIT) family protein
MNDCLFCKMAKGEIKAKIVKEGEKCFAIEDINPQAPTHLLVITKQHFSDLAAAVGGDVLEDVLAMAKSLAEERGLKAPGHRLVMNTGSDGGQTVPHLHLHLLGGRSMQWPPG